MSEHARFHLVYDGPALEQHRMDVRELAPALLAIGDLVERANELLNGESAKVSVNVRGSFKTGSFGIDLELLQSFWQQVLKLGNSYSVIGVLSIAGLLGLIQGGTSGLIQVVRWLRNRRVSRVEVLEGEKVRLWVDQDHFDIEKRILALLQDYRIRKALEDLVTKPLAREGVESIAVVRGDSKTVEFEIGRSESHYFIAPEVVEEVLDSSEYVANLQVLNAAFQDGNKWRFTDGGQSFWAEMSDTSFNERVSANREVFAKDDLLRVRVRRNQKLTAHGLQADYDVIEVLEHRSAAPQVQLRLDVPPNESGEL